MDRKVKAKGWEAHVEKRIHAPIGDFVLENAKHIMLDDGAYFHYADVCALLKKYHEFKMEETCQKN